MKVFLDNQHFTSGSSLPLVSYFLSLSSRTVCFTSVKSLQSCPNLCDPMNFSPPVSSVHWIPSRQEYQNRLSVSSWAKTQIGSMICLCNTVFSNFKLVWLFFVMSDILFCPKAMRRIIFLESQSCSDFTPVEHWIPSPLWKTASLTLQTQFHAQKQYATCPQWCLQGSSFTWEL